MLMAWNVGELLDGPLPLWWQIADRLRRAIERGEFRPGDAVPSEAQLNAAFGVSRTTARAALDELSQEGLISRKPGIGSIVLKPRVEQPLTRLAGFADDMRQRGLTASYRTFAVRMDRPEDDVAVALGIVGDSRALRITRLLIADGQPMALAESWLNPAALNGAAPPAPADLDDRSLYSWLESTCGARIVGGTQTIEATIADRALGERLCVEIGSPVLVARRRSHDLKLEAIEYVVISYRADRYRFTIDLERR